MHVLYIIYEILEQGRHIFGAVADIAYIWEQKILMHCLQRSVKRGNHVVNTYSVTIMKTEHFTGKYDCYQSPQSSFLHYF